jgi:hypothetical protein
VRWLTEDAVIVCAHELGNVQIVTSQTLVTIGRRIVLVEPDPERRDLRGCPNLGVSIKPCQHTLGVKVGYSRFVRIGGQPVVLDHLAGLTDGTPPGLVEYTVRRPGQTVVAAGS